MSAYVSLRDRILAECHLSLHSTEAIKHGAATACKLLLLELQKLRRRHGPGECVDIAHVEALIEEMIG